MCSIKVDLIPNVYSEVIAVSGIGYERDRVLDKLYKPSVNLPYTIEDIRISHNDLKISHRQISRWLASISRSYRPG